MIAQECDNMIMHVILPIKFPKTKISATLARIFATAFKVTTECEY